jgi:hypothetical protein
LPHSGNTHLRTKNRVQPRSYQPIWTKSKWCSRSGFKGLVPLQKHRISSRTFHFSPDKIVFLRQSRVGHHWRVTNRLFDFQIGLAHAILTAHDSELPKLSTGASLHPLSLFSGSSSGGRTRCKCRRSFSGPELHGTSFSDQHWRREALAEFWLSCTKPALNQSPSSCTKIERHFMLISLNQLR